MDDAIAKNQLNKARAIADDLKNVNQQINNTFQRNSFSRKEKIRLFSLT